MRRAVLAAIVALPLLAACEPTGHPRCDESFIWDVQAEIESHGWVLRCDPEPTDKRILGWADSSRKTVWLWVDKMPDDRVLKKVAWHELGHLEVAARGLTFPTQRDIEVWAERFAWCAQPFGAGVSYSASLRGVDCASYIG